MRVSFFITILFISFYLSNQLNARQSELTNDSLEVNSQNFESSDSVTTVDDSLEIEDKWEWKTGVSYSNSKVKKGVQLSSKPIMTFKTAIYHTNGLYLNFNYENQTGPLTFMDYNINLGYDYEFNDWLSFSMEYTNYNYANDSINPLAGMTNNVSMALTLDFGFVLTDLKYDKYFGSDYASYYGVSFYKLYKFWGLMFAPSLDITYYEQIVEQKRVLKKVTVSTGKQKSFYGTAIDLAFLLKYKITSNWDVYISPGISVTPKDDLTNKQTTSVFSMGTNYKLSW